MNTSECAPSPAADQLTICAEDCGARCCRYLTVAVSPPRARDDWDEMRWWLAHEGVLVTKDEDGWMLHVDTRCGNLDHDRTCRIHPHHMKTCKDYDAAICEFTGPLDYDLQLRSELDLARYLERRGLKRGAPIARAIRRAEHRKQEPRGDALVPLAGLAPRKSRGA